MGRAIVGCWPIREKRLWAKVLVTDQSAHDIRLAYGANSYYRWQYAIFIGNGLFNNIFRKMEFCLTQSWDEPENLLYPCYDKAGDPLLTHVDVDGSHQLAPIWRIFSTQYVSTHRCTPHAATNIAAPQKKCKFLSTPD